MGLRGPLFSCGTNDFEKEGPSAPREGSGPWRQSAGDRRAVRSEADAGFQLSPQSC